MQPCAVLRNGKLERTLITRLERLECTPIGGTAVRPCDREGQSEEHGRQAHPRGPMRPRPCFVSLYNFALNSHDEMCRTPGGAS